MKISLLGATGAVGGHFLNKALAAGHEVTALARSPGKLDERAGLAVIKGDAANPDDVAQLVSGADAVVSCVGNPKGSLIMERTAEAVLSAAAAEPTPPKCMFITSIGCGGSSWLIYQVLSMIVGRAGFADEHSIRARASVSVARKARLREVPRIPRWRHLCQADRQGGCRPVFA